jgi:YD repeat-containing protein
LVRELSSEIETDNPDEFTMDALPDFELIIKRDNGNGTGTKNLTTYSYNNYNRLTKTKTENNTITYGYNAQGYRVEKIVNSKSTKYLY